MLASAFTGALFHTLISLSVVCHNHSSLLLLMRIGRVDNWRPTLRSHQGLCQKNFRKFARSRRDASIKQAFKRYTEHKSETAQGVILEEALRETRLGT